MNEARPARMTISSPRRTRMTIAARNHDVLLESPPLSETVLEAGRRLGDHHHRQRRGQPAHALAAQVTGG